MPVRPLLRLPDPQAIARPPGPRGGGKPRVPDRARQRQRLDPEYQRLRRAIDGLDGGLALRADPIGIAPDRALVMEIAGSLDDFHKAVARIPGLRFLVDEELGFAPDADFAAVDKNGQDIAGKTVAGRRYVAMPSLGALNELLGLYERWRREEKMPRNFAPWGQLFTQLKTLRAWGPLDRVSDEAIAYWSEDLAAADITEVLIEAELFFAGHRDQRDATIAALKDDVAEVGGAFVTEATIGEIAYHAALLRLPVDGLQRVMARDEVRLVLDDQIMFLRPQSVVRAAALETLPPEGRLVERLAEPLAGPPIAALLDGFPLQRHQLLDGRITVDDADDLEGRATVGRRVHGTAMASLIVHGDLNRQEASLTRPLLVRPIMFSGPNDLEEHTDGEQLLIDTVHRAVVRMKDPETPGGPTAPEVVLINLAMGDRRRPFAGAISPWARLLDHLAFRYNVLFLVSAGNITDALTLAGYDGQAAFDAASADERVSAILAAVRDRQGERTLLSPSEGLNALTIGAAHDDAVAGPVVGGRIDPYPNGGFPMIGSALGLGHRRTVKPDLLLPGGRQRLNFKSSPPLTVEPARLAHGFGLRAAAPDSSARARLDARALSIGTSPATALATRAGHRIFDTLMDTAGGSNHGDVEHGHLAVLLKCLLVHSARWPETAALIAEVFGPEGGHRFSERADNIARVLGYGMPQLEQVLECSPSQATVAGVGTLMAEDGHLYRIPLPACLSAVTDPRRLVLTLAWMSPITVTHQEYRRAQLQLDAPEAGVRLGVGRATQQQPSDHASKRGSLVHEVYEGENAVPFVEDGMIGVRVWCAGRPRLRPLDVPIKYALAVTIEAGTPLPVYEQINARLRADIRT